MPMPGCPTCPEPAKFAA